jgi:hypothetical protein
VKLCGSPLPESQAGMTEAGSALILRVKHIRFLLLPFRKAKSLKSNFQIQYSIFNNPTNP